MRIRVAGACPLTGAPGRPLRRREAGELAQSYASYFGTPLPTDIAGKYFADPVQEFHCPESGLRWYEPARLGAEDFYEALASSYPWYYKDAGSWDKAQALQIMKRLRVRTVLEIGSGDGLFLSRLRDAGLNAMGIDSNSDAVARARRLGLRAYTPGEPMPIEGPVDCVCLLQTIEHVEDPARFLGEYVKRWKPGIVILTAPCFESLVGWATDPLAWPPHHATAWSERSFAVLAARLEYRLDEVAYDPNSFEKFETRREAEETRRFHGIPHLPSWKLRRLLFEAARVLRVSWAVRHQSILGVMSRRQPPSPPD